MCPSVPPFKAFYKEGDFIADKETQTFIMVTKVYDLSDEKEKQSLKEEAKKATFAFYSNIENFIYRIYWFKEKKMSFIGELFLKLIEVKGLKAAIKSFSEIIKADF